MGMHNVIGLYFVGALSLGISRTRWIAVQLASFNSCIDSSSQIGRNCSVPLTCSFRIH